MSKRASFLFPVEAVAALERIRLQTRYESGVDVIRVAVTTYSQILNLYDSGHKIIVKDKAGEEFWYSPYRPFKYPGMTQDALGEADDIESAEQKSFSFTGKTLETIEQIKMRGHVASNAEAVRASLAAYKELISIVSIGDEIVIRSDEEEFNFNPDAPYAKQTPKRLERLQASANHSLVLG